MEIRDAVCSTYHSTESEDAVDHLYKVKIYHLETSMRKRLKIESHSFFFPLSNWSYHVEVLVLVQIVDLKQVLRLEPVILAALQEQFDILPLTK